MGMSCHVSPPKLSTESADLGCLSSRERTMLQAQCRAILMLMLCYSNTTLHCFRSSHDQIPPNEQYSQKGAEGCAARIYTYRSLQLWEDIQAVVKHVDTQAPINAWRHIYESYVSLKGAGSLHERCCACSQCSYNFHSDQIATKRMTL